MNKQTYRENLVGCAGAGIGVLLAMGVFWVVPIHASGIVVDMIGFAVGFIGARSARLFYRARARQHALIIRDRVTGKELTQREWRKKRNRPHAIDIEWRKDAS